MCAFPIVIQIVGITIVRLQCKAIVDFSDHTIRMRNFLVVLVPLPLTANFHSGCHMICYLTILIRLRGRVRCNTKICTIADIMIAAINVG